MKGNDILSNRNKKLKKESAEKPFFENTETILHIYKNPTNPLTQKEEEDDEDKEEAKVNPKTLLNRVYGGCIDKADCPCKKETNDIPASKIPRRDPLYQVSNPKMVQQKATKFYGKDFIVYKSDKPAKKYKILDPNTDKWVYFGDATMEDYNYHDDDNRRRSYLSRAMNIRGNWRENPYSPNRLSITLLWL